MNPIDASTPAATAAQVAAAVTPENYFGDVLAILLVLTKLLVVLSPVLLILAPVVLPMIAGSFRNKKHGEAFETVTRMGLLATNAAADRIREGLEKATAPSSDGGVAVTQAELASIYGDALRSAYQWAKDNHVWKNVLDVFGGEEAIRSALLAIVCKKLSGSPVGEMATLAGGLPVPIPALPPVPVAVLAEQPQAAATCTCGAPITGSHWAGCAAITPGAPVVVAPVG